MQFQWLDDFRAEAADADHVLAPGGDPRSLVSRPVYLDRDGQSLPTLARWEMPDVEVDGTSPDEFKRYLAETRLFVVGGLRFIVGLGLKAQWFAHHATREDAQKLIRARGWDKILHDLRTKENNYRDMFDPRSINDFFTTCPPGKRDDDYEPIEHQTSPSEELRRNLDVRKRHPMRLRKAIEFIVLTEAILRYRFSHGMSLRRFSELTGLSPQRAYPEVVWDYLWIEPVHYCVSAPAAPDHIDRIMAQQPLVERFSALSGQRGGALYFLLMGAPGKWHSVRPACEVLSEVYSGFARVVPTTIPPHEYKFRMELFDDRKRREQLRRVEYIPELGPEPFFPARLGATDPSYTIGSDDSTALLRQVVDDLAAARGTLDADNLALRDRFVAETAPLTSAQVGGRSGARSSNPYATAARWKETGEIFSVTHRGIEYFPSFQFREGRPHPSIKPVLAALPATMSPWQRAFWFVYTNGWLDDAPPSDRLDDLTDLLSAAAREAEEVMG